MIMAEPTLHEDASQQKAFPDPDVPMVDKPGDGGEDPSPAVSARDEALANLYADYDGAVQEEISEQTPDDYLVAGMPPPDEDVTAEPPSRDANSRLPSQQQPAQLDPDGAESVAPMHPAPAERDPLPEELQGNPLADFIVMQGNVPMMKMNVNGQMVLRPLTEVQSAENSMSAANVRHRENAAWQKDLQQREQNMQDALQRSTQPSQPSPPAPADVNDGELLVKAKETISEMYQGDEELAAQKLVEFARSLPQAPAAQQVNANEIEMRAVARAKREIQEEGFRDAVQDGWNAFVGNYPDLAADRGLVRYADGLTDTIEKEHPTWSPTQVMAEAGNQTRVWRDQFKTPANEPDPLRDRRETKRELTPLPSPKTGRQEPEPEEPDQTPADYIAELRESRGQV
jgi:hypothetical protein